jgi:hypothetical protein
LRASATIDRLRLKPGSRVKRECIDDHQRTDQIRMSRGQIERDVAAETVTDDHRVVQTLLRDVIGELRGDCCEQRPVGCRHAGESGQRQHMTGVLIFVVRHAALPGVAGRSHAGNEEGGL